MKAWRKNVVLTILFLLTMIPLLGARERATIMPRLAGGNRAVERDRSGDSQSPVDAVLTWDGQPGLHRTVSLTLRVTSEVEADRVTLRWVSPAGVTLSGSATETVASVTAGEEIVRQRDVTFDQSGSFRVAVAAQIEFSHTEDIFGDADLLYFTIEPGPGSQVSRQGPRITSTRERIEAPGLTYGVTTHPNQGYWVRGRFLFEDREVGPLSNPPVMTFTNVPARQVLVEVWEDDGLIEGPSPADDRDCSTRTDDDGYFECWIHDNDDIWGDKETYVRVYADTPGAHVSDISGLDRDYYCYTDDVAGGSDIDFGTLTPSSYDPMFNIADALLDAYRYALQFRDSVDQAHARYEPGRGEDVSHYSSISEEITIQDAAPDADPYDDSVILHEYGHFIADFYACNESEGGSHNWFRHYSNELAWSEGWSSYLASAVRNTPHYLNVNDAGGWQSQINLETWDVDHAVTGSNNEGAVAATLWDIHDSADETHDVLSLGGEGIWDTFDAQMDGSRDCNIFEFWDEWHDADWPDDSELAAIFGQHGTAGVTASGAGLLRDRIGEVAVSAADGLGRGANRPSGGSIETVTRGGVPWDAVLFLVDATNSMAEEIDAVTQIIQDKVVAMDAEPDHPYEYIVETFQDDGANTPIVDHFFPEVVNPPIDGITIGGGGGPREDTFAALARGTSGRLGYDAWLFTDAAPSYEVIPAVLETLLQHREITPYFFIFGDCSDGNAAGVRGEGAPEAGPFNHLHLPRFAPAAFEDCVEPYLLAANSANGQFLLIDVGQEDDAAEIVRAFMSNNAGSGRYADYVSSSWSYTWENADYYWRDATGGTAWNIANYQEVLLPGDFPFYGVNHDRVYIAAPGYISFSEFNAVSANTGIPTPALPNNAIYAFWDDITAYQLPQGESAPEQTPAIYTLYNWELDAFIIEYHDAYHVGTTDYETFEIILDYNSGDIYLQYAEVTDDSSCTVGVENASGSTATQIAYNNPYSLYPGRAIRLIPMPPQPTLDHEVIVDSTMDNVIFMLNGYSGDVNMTLYRPNGVPVDPSDPDVTFMEVGKVLYYRVSSPTAGTWVARASGEGTYYFTSSSTSSLDADLESDPAAPRGHSSLFLVDLGMDLTVDPSFSLVHPDGTFGSSLTLYDDGLHQDGEADDGLYGGENDTPYASDSYYLQVDGQTPAGEDFRRTALTPIRLQAMDLELLSPPEQFALPGEMVDHTFRLTNHDYLERCFTVEAESTHGWATVPEPYHCLAPDASTEFNVSVYVPYATGNVVDQLFVTAWNSTMLDSVSVATIVRGWVTKIDLAAYPDRIYNNGGQALIVAQVEDDLGWSVADGTTVSFQTGLGTINPASGYTVNGLVTATLTSGAATGIAEVQATADGLTEMVTVEIVLPEAYSLTLSVGDAILPPNGISTTLVTVHVYDRVGDPAPDGSQVVLSVEGDGMEMGDIEGQQSYTTTTSGGMASATYRSGTVSGVAIVRGAIPLGGSSEGGEGVTEWRWARRSVLLTGLENAIYLPVVFKGTP